MTREIVTKRMIEQAENLAAELKVKGAPNAEQASFRANWLWSQRQAQIEAGEIDE